MLPSLEWRFSLGRFLTPVLLGYGRAKAPDSHGGRKKVLEVNVGSSCALGHGGEIDGRTRPQASALPAANVAKTLFFYQIFCFVLFVLYMDSYTV